MFASAFVAGLLTIGVSYYFNLKDLRPYLDAQLITANAQAKQAYSSDNLENPRHFHLTTQYPYDHPNFTKELAGVLDATSTVSWSDSYKLKTPFKDLPHIGFSYISNNLGTYRTYTTQDENNPDLYFITYQEQQQRHILESGIVTKFLLIFFIIYLILFYAISIALKRSMAFVDKCRILLSEKENNPEMPITSNDIPSEITPFFSALDKYLDQLQQSLEREKRFAADAAHELKTPLAALNTHLQVYTISSDTEKKQHAFKQAQASLKRSFHTIEQLLVLSKILPESIHQQLDPVDPKVFFSRIKNDYPNLSLSLEINLESKFKAHHTCLTILTQNIFSNASKYGADHILVKLTQSSEHTVLQFIDNGPGVPEEHLPRLSERFFRIYGTQVDGAGIGLSIVKQIADFHQATIQFSNESPNGLGIRISFPLIK